LACPPSAGYRLRKFARRHKGPVLTAASLLAMLLVTLALALLSNSEINAALGERNAAFRNLEEEQENTNGASQEERHARQELTRTVYERGIALADGEWYDSRVEHAEELLATCPAELRGWEWHYLKRRCHAELAILHGHAKKASRAVFSPDGKRLATADDEGTLKVWDIAGDAQDAAPRFTVRGHAGPI